MVVLINCSREPFPGISVFCTEFCILHLWPYKIQCYISMNASILAELISVDVMVGELEGNVEVDVQCGLGKAVIYLKGFHQQFKDACRFIAPPA